MEIKKIGLFAAAAALSMSVGLCLAAPAQAGPVEFIDYMVGEGAIEPHPSVTTEAVDLGYAICGLFDAGGTAMDAMDTLTRPEKAAWVVGAVHFLCPQYMYLLP